jgi:hypothetical protein
LGADAKMDENYYDLDDDFIDDGDLEMIDQDDDLMLYNDADTSRFANSEVQDIREDDSDRNNENSRAKSDEEN